MDTIFAPATARGRSGVAVVRISGSRAFHVAELLAGGVPPARRAVRRMLRDGDKILDEGLVLAFPGPGSFTGEDVIEFHLHGSVAAVDSVLTSLGRLDGLRLAEPGEFTRRALENEKLDLAQVEGLADLIEAETEAQHRQALLALSGALGERAESWRRRLVRAAALIEATIDFADEDVPINVVPEVDALISEVMKELDTEAGGTAAAERIRGGFQVAIVGPPNVGKSTLLNALAGREAAITSEIAGTTRDVIEVQMELRGLAVTILDTAGLRDSADTMEALGIERALERAAASDLCLVLLEKRGHLPAFPPRKGDIVVVSKSDTGEGDFSAASGEGLDELVDRVGDELERRVSGAGVAVRARHREAILAAATSLGIAKDRLQTNPEIAELIAEDLRTGIRALDSLVGRVDVEHILDEIFKSFCIGK